MFKTFSAHHMFISTQHITCLLGRPFWPQHLINMNKITYRQAEIDSSMPGEFKKCNQTILPPFLYLFPAFYSTILPPFLYLFPAFSVPFSRLFSTFSRLFPSFLPPFLYLFPAFSSTWRPEGGRSVECWRVLAVEAGAVWPLSAIVLSAAMSLFAWNCHQW